MCGLGGAGTMAHANQGAVAYTGNDNTRSGRAHINCNTGARVGAPGSQTTEIVCHRGTHGRARGRESGPGGLGHPLQETSLVRPALLG